MFSLVLIEGLEIKKSQYVFFILETLPNDPFVPECTGPEARDCALWAEILMRDGNVAGRNASIHAVLEAGIQHAVGVCQGTEVPRQDTHRSVYIGFLKALIREDGSVSTYVSEVFNWGAS